MLRKINLLIVVLLYVTPLFAQFDFASPGGRGAAMGGASVSLDDEASAMSNVAALSGVRRTTVVMGVRQCFMAERMGTFVLGGALPLGTGCGAAMVEHYGNSDYNEQRVSLDYALPLGNSISLGVALHYLHSGTADPYYDPLNRVTFSTAIRYKPSDDFAVAFKAFNPVSVKSDSEYSLQIPAIFTLGVSYMLTDELLIVGEVEKDIYREAMLRFGLEYALQEAYFFRVGINTVPAIYTMGFGLRQGKFGADIAIQYHNVLGITPQVSLQYSF